MLTLKSKFAEFISLCVKNGACSKAGEWVYTQEDSMTIREALDLAAVDKFVQGGAWTLWAISHFGKELDATVRKIYIQNTVTDPKIACRLHAQCFDFLTEGEVIILKQIYEGKMNDATIKSPIDAAQLYIDCAPILSISDSLSLKAVFDGKLPTIEKELVNGTVIRKKVLG